MKTLILFFSLVILTACNQAAVNETDTTVPEEKLYSYWPSQGQAQITYEVIKESSPAYEVSYPKINNLSPNHPVFQAVNDGYVTDIQTFKSDATTFYSDSDEAVEASASIPWDYTVEWLGGRYSPKVWSLAFLIYTYQGGAHGNSYTDTYNYYAPNNKIITLNDLFAGEEYLPALNKKIMDALVAEKTERWAEYMENEAYDVEQDAFLKEVTFDERSLGSWVVSERNGELGILFFFAPYAVGAYAEGSFEAFVPASDFQDYLKEEYKEIFE
ncbi:DUF3298 and DUF4163 domain-containing protein [bacterium]|nr:DUF3298 and DUF4163 domain-containing protein [bacterium]NCQ55692.1 DUF3298 and DUF4163 domain-containing protein [Candidatus Parcubacteria bacterium]NCS67641.1 DUF3298 and DUF4163 domain-containing protein [Candidatus Peregrinibacteria bacterium]NCS96655.1 DUF3298 and DUF4163 domain-containing protein [bacterium]